MQQQVSELEKVRASRNGGRQEATSRLTHLTRIALVLFLLLESGQFCWSATVRPAAVVENVTSGGGSANKPPVIINVSSLIVNNSSTMQHLDNQGTNNLHLGAKISLTIFSATVALVVIATLVDCHLELYHQQQQQQHQASPAQGSSHNHQHRHRQHHKHDHEHEQQSWRGMIKKEEKKKKKKQANKRLRSPVAPSLRNYRSLSLSSNCSSNICCSVNSIASSSIPILKNSSNNNNNSQHYHSNLLCQLPSSLVAAEQQAEEIGPVEIKLPAGGELESNTWLALQRACLPAEASSASSASSSSSNSDIERQRPAALQQVQLITQDHERRSASALSLAASSCSLGCAARGIKSDHQQQYAAADTAAAADNRRHKRIGLEILLAFSLRQSSKQIFQANASNRSPSERMLRANGQDTPPVQPKQQQQQQSEYSKEHEEERPAILVACGSLAATTKSDTEIDDNNNGRYARKIAANELGHERRAESIDSLHGLRFLSMIWVIVIHSYNFALRWMYFTNENTLQGIYKSFASQLLANGSFACDSFFFVGGFLLPYLAFSGAKSGKRMTTKNRAEDLSGENRKLEKSDNFQGPQVAPELLNEQKNKKKSAKRADSKQLESLSASQPISCCFSCCSCFCFCLVPSQNSTSQPAGTCRLGEISKRPQNHERQRVVESAHANTNELAGTCDSTSSSFLFNPMLANYYCGCKLNPAPATKNRLDEKLMFIRSPSIMTDLENQQQHQQQQQQKKKQQQEAMETKGQERKRPHSGGCQITVKRVLANILHRYVRMMPLMMSIIGLSATLLRYLGDSESSQWNDSTMMFDQWCRKNWWVNAMFLHNFVNRENMCLSHSWYSAVDIQLFLLGQLILFVLDKSRRLGLALLFCSLFASQLLNGILTIWFHLPAVPLVASVSEQTMNLYYGQIYIKPYCRASPYLIGLLLAYLMRTTRLGELRLSRWQVNLAWCCSLATIGGILFAMQPAMNGHQLNEWQSAFYSSLSRPLWACALAWIIFACITKQSSGIFRLIDRLLQAKIFIPLSRLTYPAFLIHPIVMAVFYGSRQSAFHFSHYLMLYLILGNIVITYACAFVLATLFELPLISVERTLSTRFWSRSASGAAISSLDGGSQQQQGKETTSDRKEFRDKNGPASFSCAA